MKQIYSRLRGFFTLNRSKYGRPAFRRRAPSEELDVLSEQDSLEPLRRVAVIDTEMHFTRVIQFAGVMIEYRDGAFREAARRDFYVRLPEGEKMAPSIREVTGITDELLRSEGIEEDRAVEEIGDFLSAADAIAGQAVINDTVLLRKVFRRWKRRCPPSLAKHVLLDIAPMVQCLYGLEHPVNLRKAAELTGVMEESDSFHDARCDADVASRILRRELPRFVREFGCVPLAKAHLFLAPREKELLDVLPESYRKKKKKKAPAPETGAGDRTGQS